MILKLKTENLEAKKWKIENANRMKQKQQKKEDTEAKKIFDLLQMLKQKNKMLQIRGKKVLRKV